MALTAPYIVKFTDSVDSPQKMIPMNQVKSISKLDISATPSGVQSGIDNSKTQLVFDMLEPFSQGGPIIVNFGPSAQGNRDLAYTAAMAQFQAL